MRKHVYTAIDDHEKESQPQLKLLNNNNSATRFDPITQSEEGQLLSALVCEYLQYHGLDHTLSVFQAETGSTTINASTQSRAAVAQRLTLATAPLQHKPLLASVLAQAQRTGGTGGQKSGATTPTQRSPRQLYRNIDTAAPLQSGNLSPTRSVSPKSSVAPSKPVESINPSATQSKLAPLPAMGKQTPLASQQQQQQQQLQQSASRNSASSTSSPSASAYNSVKHNPSSNATASKAISFSPGDSASHSHSQSQSGDDISEHYSDADADADAAQVEEEIAIDTSTANQDEEEQSATPYSQQQSQHPSGKATPITNSLRNVITAAVKPATSTTNTIDYSSDVYSEDASLDSKFETDYDYIEAVEDGIAN